MSTDTRTEAHEARIASIVDAAAVRRHLGQAAVHRRLPDARHVVILHGQEFVGTTLDEAIGKARAGKDEAA